LAKQQCVKNKMRSMKVLVIVALACMTGHL